jgi:hypothetical protein
MPVDETAPSISGIRVRWACRVRRTRRHYSRRSGTLPARVWYRAWWRFRIVGILLGIVVCLLFIVSSFISFSFFLSFDIVSASSDNIRLWNATEAGETDGGGIGSKGRSGAQFKIIPGHHGGYVSQMRTLIFLSPCVSSLMVFFTNAVVDPGARFMVTASSNRGWHGDSTRTVFIHDIKLSP